MPNRAIALADKLISEGERTLTYFRALPASAWQQPIYGEGANWLMRDVFEHLIISETTLLRLFQRIVSTGAGIEDDFNIDQFNADHTRELTALSMDELAQLYTQTRQRTADFTRELTDEQLAMRARHPAIGDSTLEDMLKLIYLHHSMHTRDVKKLISQPT
jgi:hypothetical protein